MKDIVIGGYYLYDNKVYHIEDITPTYASFNKNKTYKHLNRITYDLYDMEGRLLEKWSYNYYMNLKIDNWIRVKPNSVEIL